MAKASKTPRFAASDQQDIGLVKNLQYGRAVGLSFFRKNAWLIVIFLVIILSLMGLRFKTMAKMSEIKALSSELETARSEKLQYKSKYMSLIRETEMQRLVNEQGLNLEFQEQPPYELALDNNSN